MKLRYVLLLTAIFVASTAVYVLFFTEKVKPALYTFAEVPLHAVDNTSFQLDMVDTEFTLEHVEKPSSSAEKKVNQYNIYYHNELAGILSMEEREIRETGDYYYFLQYKPVINLKHPLLLRASIASTSKQIHKRYVSYPEHEQQVAQGSVPSETPPILQDGVLHQPVVLEKRMELPADSLYLEGDTFSLHLNRVNVYEPLANGVRKAYDQLSPSFFYDFRDSRHYLEISLPNEAGMEVEHWGIVGSAGMFGWENDEQADLYTVADANRVRKWTQGGFQYITPSTYEPYDPNGFWIVPAQHVGNRLLLSGTDRFSRNIAILSLQAALETQTEEGMWLTQPRSEWLYDDYGIEAGFYDTRFSTDAGLFLIYGYREFGDPSFLDGARAYADYLVEFARTHHFLTENGGYLVYDYRDGVWDGSEPKKTHVSLNHLVTEMNFLYEVYKELTKGDAENNSPQAEEYLAIAEKMRIAVHDTRDYWKKEENGDLWYAYMPDGSYDLLDYPLLTLKDLRYSQELIEEIHGSRDPHFQYLIEVKESYLLEQGLPLYD